MVTGRCRKPIWLKLCIQFNEGEVDILLSTTIIESGLDIPNANTLIVDRADTFGLGATLSIAGQGGPRRCQGLRLFFQAP